MKTYPQKKFKNVYCNLIGNSKNWKHPKYPLKKGIANQTVVYSCNGMLLSNKMEVIIWNDMDKSQKPYVKSKSDTKEHVLYDSMYIKFKNGQKEIHVNKS